LVAPVLPHGALPATCLGITTHVWGKVVFCRKCQERISQHPFIVKKWIHVNRDIETNHGAIPDFAVKIRGVLVDS